MIIQGLHDSPDQLFLGSVHMKCEQSYQQTVRYENTYWNEIF